MTEIWTERLHLREFVVADWMAVFRYQSKPDYLHYYAWTERREEDVKQ